MMQSVYNEKMKDEMSRPTAVTVTELNAEWNASTDTLNSPRPQHLPPKLADIHRKRTWRNVSIIAAFVVAYSAMVVIAVVPELMGSFPFMPASFSSGYTTFSPPCTPFGMPQARFEVNLSWGELTYLEAKAIDAMWNLTVGRGLQALFAWASFELFSIGVLRIVQDNPISLSLYTKLAFSTTSVTVLPHLVSSIWHTRGWRCKAILIWLMVSIAHLLSFPALLDLSTGYISSMDVMLKLEDTTYATINNATSLGQSIIFDCRNKQGHTQTCVGGWVYGSSCYDNIDYFTNCNATNQMVMGNHTLLITDVVQGEDGNADGQWLYWSIDQPSRRLKCVPGSAYSWGFSTGYLWIVSTLTSLWTLGMMVLWLDSLRFGVLWRSGRHVGDYRHVLDIAYVLQERLGPNTCMYSNPELAREVKKLGPVGFHVETDAHSRGHIGLAEQPGGCSHVQVAGVEFGCKSRLRTKAPTWRLQNNVEPEHESGTVQPGTRVYSSWDWSQRLKSSRPVSLASQSSTTLSRYPSLYRSSTFDESSNARNR